MRQGAGEKRRQPDQVGPVGAVAVQQDNELAGRAARGGCGCDEAGKLGEF